VRIGAAMHVAFEGDTHKAVFKAVEEGFEAWNVGCCDGNGEDALRDDVVVDPSITTRWLSAYEDKLRRLDDQA
jgi:hypothetical protein